MSRHVSNPSITRQFKVVQHILHTEFDSLMSAASVSWTGTYKQKDVATNGNALVLLFI